MVISIIQFKIQFVWYDVVLQLGNMNQGFINFDPKSYKSQTNCVSCISHTSHAILPQRVATPCYPKATAPYIFVTTRADVHSQNRKNNAIKVGKSHCTADPQPLGSSQAVSAFELRREIVHSPNVKGQCIAFVLLLGTSIF